MKKRLFSLLLIFALALSLCAAAHADVSRFIYDEDDTIGAEDERILEELRTFSSLLSILFAPLVNHSQNGRNPGGISFNPVPFLFLPLLYGYR